MSDAFIQLPDDSGNAGKKVRTNTRLVGGEIVHEHVFSVVDSLPSGDNNIGNVDVVSSALPAGAATEGTLGGLLTNGQLRAVPVPVSGTVTATGPVTDGQLRATPVPVSGSVTATGPLTDAQLRATPVPVTASGPLTDAQLRASAPHVVVDSSPGLTDTQLRAT